MIDRRRKNVNWWCADDEGNSPTPSATLAVLMDIRDELQKLNTLLHCQNATDIPTILRAIRKNTAKPRTPRAAQKK